MKCFFLTVRVSGHENEQNNRVATHDAFNKFSVTILYCVLFIFLADVGQSKIGRKAIQRLDLVSS